MNTHINSLDRPEGRCMCESGYRLAEDRVSCIGKLSCEKTLMLIRFHYLRIACEHTGNDYVVSFEINPT